MLLATKIVAPILLVGGLLGGGYGATVLSGVSGKDILNGWFGETISEYMLYNRGENSDSQKEVCYKNVKFMGEIKEQSMECGSGWSTNSLNGNEAVIVRAKEESNLKEVLKSFGLDKPSSSERGATGTQSASNTESNRGEQNSWKAKGKGKFFYPKEFSCYSQNKGTNIEVICQRKKTKILDISLSAL
ncbi:hypothetical protein MSUIS_05520 [Mycoplasma suis KI3806]|uniref:Uncharacterized protein n=1 Tax=Mycoplasma suis (strain KI_3806) TaxID=708248 RepID=F0V1W4_MYCS3|nr:hypothetical protein [Mycoplasma suis]CBZ40645.1 hypothetical protein MSUIS_05520 [Mycoplasma suis KI3806]